MTAICHKCGRDCKTALALGKHETKGCEVVESVPSYAFTNWQETKGDFKTIAERCPRCSNEIAQFWKKDEWTWVCLECGINFTPRTKLRELIGIKDGTPR